MTTTKQKTKPCESCGKPFTVRNSRSKFCTKKCCTAYHSGVPATVTTNLSNTTVGAIGELMVCTDLLKKGFAVFRAVSASCPCDLAFLLDNKLHRVEVTTGYRTRKGKIIHPVKDQIKFDYLAVLIHNDETIHYSPDLPNK